MASTREQLVRAAAARGKYAPLYHHLVSIPASSEWRATFGEVEAILGFRLPDSARLYRPCRPSRYETKPEAPYK